MAVVEEQIVKPYHQTDRFSLYEGDCRSVLPLFADCYFDSVVCDPPYELGFMGKGWDRSGIAYDVDVWRECLRVLKPGGHLLAFGGSRTYHRLACAIEDAGFEIRDQIQWLYGSGFPKSLDVSKAIDSRGEGLYRRAYVEAVQEAGLVLPANSKWDWTIGEHSPGNKWWAIFCEWLPSLSELDRERINRIVIGKGFKPRPTFHTGNIGSSALGNEYDITVSASDEGRRWNGWGTALKPAHEPIVLARKPLIGTVAENVLQHGTGGLNIDGCRIATSETLSAGSRRLGDGIKYNLCEPSTEYEQNQNGRWPANVIHDGSEEVLTAFPDAPGQQGDLNGHSKDRLSKGIFGDMKAARDAVARLDSGSAARFFYCAKATQEDRNEGLEGVGPRQQDLSRKEGNPGGDNPRNRGLRPRANHHPTVKPTDLMRYLCRLITPPGGIVLDPFCGSGSTGKAAMLEGFKFVGIELNADYCQLAQLRIEAVTRQGLLFA